VSKRIVPTAGSSAGLIDGKRSEAVVFQLKSGSWDRARDGEQRGAGMDSHSFWLLARPIAYDESKYLTALARRGSPFAAVAAIAKKK